jgi:hypothetical protein
VFTPGVERSSENPLRGKSSPLGVNHIVKNWPLFHLANPTTSLKLQHQRWSVFKMGEIIFCFQNALGYSWRSNFFTALAL